ncbi:MAG: TSUP family transporter [Spirochaetales bacterium]
MPDLLSFWPLAALVAAAFAAGLMDAIAGGGGLITVPVLLATGLSPLEALGTNKLQSSFGSGMALYRYARAGLVPREEVLPAVGFTAAGAVAGTLTVGFLPSAWLGWLITAILALVLAFVFFQPEWGQTSTAPRWKTLPFFAVFGLALGFYDGFLGPGTGTFWTLALIALLGRELAVATAQTKVSNFTSNLVALAIFALQGHVLWIVGLAMGAAQAAGAWVGSHLALRRGAKFIRVVFLLVVAATLVKVMAQG